jgi:hypothetical protein
MTQAAPQILSHGVVQHQAGAGIRLASGDAADVASVVRDVLVHRERHRELMRQSALIAPSLTWGSVATLYRERLRLL